VLVDAPPGEPVQLEIVPYDTSKPMGLVESIWSEEPELRITVAGGVAYVYNAGTGRLTARRGAGGDSPRRAMPRPDHRSGRGTA
jgi:hypothetical protein